MPPNPAFPIADRDKDLVLHSLLELGDSELMCSDGSGTSTVGDNMYVSVTVKDADYVKRAWDVLKEGGEVYMELAPSFFAVLHGSLRDRFGINWMFTVLK